MVVVGIVDIKDSSFDRMVDSVVRVRLSRSWVNLIYYFIFFLELRPEGTIQRSALTGSKVET